jgi:putative multiple sugar transport system permease protein
MYFALFIIIVIFTITTNGVFISSRNIGNLLNQTGYIAVLAVGMTLVIVIRHIDLSVGFLAGFLGAVAAIALVSWHLSVWIVIPFALVLGILAGLLTALPVAQLGIPSFVASLAGWLIYRGALLLVTLKTGTIIIPDPVFNAIGNDNVPDLLAFGNFLPGVHKLTIFLGMLGIAWYIVGQFRARRSKKAYGFEVLPADLFVLKLIFISVIIGLITWVVAGYNGMSWTLVIVLVVVGVYNFITTRTVLAGISTPSAETPRRPS